MSSTARRSTPATHAGHKSPTTENHGSNVAHTRGVSQSPNSPNSSPSRTPSSRQTTNPVSARAAARKPGVGRSNLSMSAPRTISNNSSEDDLRAENAGLIGELKEQVQKAETVSEQYRKQLGVLQLRLDEAVREQGRLEDQAHEKDGTIAALRDEVRELTRHIRGLDQAHEADRAAMVRDKEQQANKEEELQSTIQRLKETLAQKDLRANVENECNQSRSRKLTN